MGRKRNSQQPPHHRDRRQREQAAFPSAERCATPPGSVGRSSTFPLSVLAPPTRAQVLAICGLLLAAVSLVFGQTVRYGFVNLDDGMYVYENRVVSQGLTAPGIAWVFTHSHGGNWHPVTSLSHMLDCQLYGLCAVGHHLTNVLLHAATAILLFLVLWRMTDGVWPSAAVAALFAVHPLRVESVAWVAERKDVLSGLFFVLTLATYVWYVRGPFSARRYLLLVAVFVLGLMTKSMLVTLPLVLLLLDYWPLRRRARAAADRPVARGRRAGRFSFPLRLLLEKLPLLLLTAVFCVVTLWAQGEAVALKDSLSMSWRVTNALVSYVAYLVQFFYPVGLAAYYPHPDRPLPMWEVIGAAVVLACISAAALACWRRYPYVLVGWLWYVGMLVPVIGLVQVGAQAMADRYTYLPQIGLYIALAWGAADVCRSWPYRRWLWSVASVLGLAVLMGCAWRQTSFWQDSKTLWTHTLAYTSRNHVAHNSLGLALADQGQFDEAIVQYQKALEIRPNYAEAHNNLGLALVGVGRFDEALAHYRQAVEIKPGDAVPYNNFGAALVGQDRPAQAVPYYEQAVKIDPKFVQAQVNFGSVLTTLGRPAEAIAHFQKALEIQPDYPVTHQHYGKALADLGRLDEAIAHYQKVLASQPDHAETHNDLGAALVGQGRFGEALAHFRQALEIQPDHAAAHNNLAWLLATCPLASLRDGAAAIEHARQANQFYGGGRPDVLNTLAAAYAEAGRFPEALATARKALELATRQKATALADSLRSRIALYAAGKPFHQAPPSSAPLPPRP